MKKVSLIFCFLLLSFSLVSCNKDKISNDNSIEISQSSKFSKDEIEEAIQCVKDNFSFPEATLTTVWYDEEKSNDLIEEYLKNGNGSINGVKLENLIIILSNFDVDGSGDNPVLTPNTTYSNYKWILIRNDKNSYWEIDDFGY